jgi:hypothetical protein
MGSEMDASEKERLVSYLLGTLPVDERDSVERRYFVDDSYFEALRAAEWELVDDHLKGRLSPELERLFAGAYLAQPSRRARVELARNLMGVCSEMGRSEVRKGFWPSLRGWFTARAVPVPAGACVAVGGVFLFLSVGILYLRGVVARLDGHQRLSFMAGTAPAPASALVQLALGGSPRGGTSLSVPAAIPAAVPLLRISISGAPSANASRIVIQTPEGLEICRLAAISGSTGEWETLVPRSILAGTDYIVVLEALGSGGQWERVGTAALAIRAAE